MTVTKSFGDRLWGKQQYESLSGEEREDDISQNSPDDSKTPNRTLKSRCLPAALILGFILIMTVWVVLKYAVHRQSAWDQCGTTPEEARSRGCVFEMTLSLWVPKQCYDRELEEEYIQSEGLVYYRDLNFTQEVPLNEVKMGEQYAWFVPWQHHIRHCIFGLRKFHRAVMNGGKIDGYLLNYNHTMHCLGMMTDPPEKVSPLPQRDVRMYPYCGKKGGYNVEKTRRHQWVD